MKSSNEVRLGLEVLEDRLALSGAFSGAIGAGPPFPFNALAANLSNFGPPLPNSPAAFNSQPSGNLQSLQSQLQSLQAAQTAMIDQFFSEVQSMLQALNIHTFLIL